MPPQASEPAPEGAAAFTKFWIDTFNYAARSGNTEELRKFSAPRCRACIGYAVEFEKPDAPDVNGRLWSMKKHSPVTIRSANPLRVEVDVIAKVGSEKKPFTFIFELPDRPPFSVMEIRRLASA